MSRRGNHNTGSGGQSFDAAPPATPAKAPQTFHMTSADFRDPAYDFTAFENWIAQVSGAQALQDAVNWAHRYERQALAGGEFVVSSQGSTTPADEQIAS